MNEHVATKLRSLRELIPQTPWPDVHPLASLVPNPTIDDDYSDGDSNDDDYSDDDGNDT